MRPSLLAKYNSLKQKVLNSDKAIFDETKNAFYSMYLSDALVSDSSSIVRQYIFTGKPIYSITSSENCKSKFISKTVAHRSTPPSIL